MGLPLTTTAPPNRASRLLRGLPFSLLCLCALLTIPAGSEVSQTSRVFEEHHRGWAFHLQSRPDLLMIITPEDELDAREIATQIDADTEFLITDDEEKRPLAKAIGGTDAVIASGHVWTLLSDENRQTILDHCSQSRGLLILGNLPDSGLLPDSASGTLSQLPWQANANAADSLMQWDTSALGDGILIRSLAPIHSKHHTLIPVWPDSSLRSERQYDNAISEVIKAILHASGHKPAGAIKAFTRFEMEKPDPDEIPPQLPTEYTQYMSDAQMKPLLSVFNLELEEPATQSLNVSVRVRRDDDPIEWQISNLATLPKGAQSTLVHLPLGRGAMTIDVWLENERGVSDWSSERVSVDNWPLLERVRFTKYLVEPNDSLEVTFSVRANLFAPAATFAHLLVTDTFGRVIAHEATTVSPEGGNHRTRVAWSDALTHALRVDLYLSPQQNPYPSLLDRRVASHAQTNLVVQQNDREGLLWAVPHSVTGEPGTHGLLKRLSRAGVDLALSSSGTDTDTAALEANLATIVRYPRLEELSGGGSACLSTSEWRQRQYSATASWGQWAKGLGIRHTLWSWDKNDAGFCGCEACGDLLATELRSYYPSLEALNRSWDTSYTDWTAITMQDQSDSPAQMVDMKRANRDRAEAAERELAVLFSGNAPGLAPTAWLNNTHEAGVANRIARASLTFGPDSAPSSARLRSYRAEGRSTGLWWNDETDPASLPWRALAEAHTVIHTPEDLAESDDFLQSLAAARNGIDTLILAATAQPASVGVYENDSTLFCVSENDQEQLRESRSAMTHVLNNLALPHRFISYDQLMTNALRNLRILLVPRVTSLSPEERAMFRAFAKNGGSIITDALSGTLDEHGNPPSDPGLHVGALIDFDDTESLRTVLETTAEELGLERSRHTPNPSSDDDSIHWNRYTFGAADIFFGLQSDPEKTDRPALALADNEYGYDLLTSKFIKQGKARAQVNPWGASIFSVLPYRVSRLIIETPGVVAAGQRLSFRAQVKTFDALPGDHLLRVRLLDPAGIELTHYETTTYCADGSGQGYFPLALNDPSGIYTLEFTDLLSGITATANVEVL